MVKWTDHAKAQLRHIHDYIAQDSAYYAKHVVAELVNKTIGLDELQRIGKIVAELNDESVREISLYSYRILYEINPTQIDVLAVIHKRRDLKPDDIPR
ncbi:MAG TPA: type II toxin-antitoxin system RelE/ParE family toxin [Arenimonas sp.]|nr:type II toxin-antitoxin system RelE/ParE family toxin [Arenimonas sp.]